MKILTSREAGEIARKLGANIDEGRKHAKVKIRWQGRIVASYNIRRGSGETSHDYIPKQTFISSRQALDLARCPLSRDQYFEILRSKGKLPS